VPTFSFVWNLPTNYLCIGLRALLFQLKRQEKLEPRTLRHDSASSPSSS
jgi:cytochrome c-type biogenesis protein CcmH/NrfF